MKASLGPRKQKKNKWIIPITTLLVSLLIELYFKDYLYDKSRKTIIYLQEKILDSDGNKISKSSKLFSRIIQIIFYIQNTNLFYFLICTLLYNFLNVYKIFILYSSILISNFFSSIFCLIFHSPRPFMVDSKILPLGFVCSEWGSPSREIVTIISFYLTLYHILTQNKYMEKFKKLKIFITILLCVLTLCFLLLQFFSGVVSYDQIIFSIFLGVFCYFLMFSLLSVDVNDPKQLYIFIRFKMLYYLPINFFIGIFLFILYHEITNNEELVYYSNNINLQIGKSIDFDDIFSKYTKNSKEFFMLNNGVISNITCFFCNIPIILGLKTEYFSIYNKNYSTWVKNNFSSYNSLENFSIFNDYKYVEESQWNKTSIVKTIIRIILNIILCILCLIPMIIPSKIEIFRNDFSFFYFYTVLPLFLISFGNFYFFKVIYRLFGLTKKIRE
jgi:hypothetical protein